MFSWGGKSSLTESTDPNASLLQRRKNLPRHTAQPDSSHSCPSQVDTQDYGSLHGNHTILIIIIIINSLIYYTPIAVSPPSFPPRSSPTVPSSSLRLCVTVIVTLILGLILVPLSLFCQIIVPSWQWNHLHTPGHTSCLFLLHSCY